MIKTLEAVIAITILLLFFLTISQTIDFSKTKTNTLEKNISKYVQINAEKDEFRQLIESKNSEEIYNTIFKNIENNYSVSVCDFLNNDCNSYNIIDQNGFTIKYIDYYFYDINKVLNIGVWIK
ncbi:MAG: hypothetical protein PHR26_04025 [Candidatus ainarchaeum sp.]|nr:hypothetical protein [Candidatus ainarchaeum sp.]MDD3975618.1 hypothetical protein [Candidatus ainarchaeum sp.]